MSGKFFDLNFIPGVKEGFDLERSGSRIEKFMSIHGERIEGLRKLTGIPKDGEIVFLWSVKSFNAFTFIPFILKNSGIITELIISTFSINRRIIDALVRLIDQGEVLKVDLLISESVKTRL